MKGQKKSITSSIASSMTGDKDQKEFKVDADNYSLTNLCLSMSISTLTITSIMNPFSIVTYRSIRDVKECSKEHYSQKSLRSTLLNNNPGRLKECGNCLESTNAFMVAKEIVRKEGGWRALAKGVQWNLGQNIMKHTMFIYIYEKGKLG